MGSYFLKRLTRPVKKEPIPSSASSGSGDAVCGSLFCAVWVPAAFWSAAFALWSAAAGAD